jgi:hypothetical protein
MHTSKLVLSVFGLMLIAALPANAHHSFTAGYESDKRIMIEGTVTGFDYMSPHSLMHLDVKGADGTQQAWLLEFGSPLILRKFGWTPTTFKAGDFIKATGAPAHSGASRLYVFELTRPADGFTYKPSPAEAAKDTP